MAVSAEGRVEHENRPQTALRSLSNTMPTTRGVGEGQTHTPMCVDGYMAMRDLSVPFTSTHQGNVIHTVPLPFTHETLDILPVSHNRESYIYP